MRYPVLVGVVAALLCVASWVIVSSVTGVTDVAHNGFWPVAAQAVLTFVPAALLGLAVRWWSNRAERKRG